MSSELKARVFTALSLALVFSIALVLSSRNWLGQLMLFSLFALASGIASLEFFRMLKRVSRTGLGAVAKGLLVLPLLLALSYLATQLISSEYSKELASKDVLTLALFATLATYLMSIFFMATRPAIEVGEGIAEKEGSSAEPAGAELGKISVHGEAVMLISALPLLVFGMTTISALVFHPSGEMIIFGGLLVVAAHDIASYFAGKRFGTTRIYRSISPGKTLEGSLAGLIGALIASQIYFFFIAGMYTVPQTSLLSLVIALLAAGGDLSESLWKRMARVKDSGSILPGHGGVLDRIDALLLAIPGIVIFDIALF